MTTPMRNLARDAIVALRGFSRRPVFLLVAVASLGLGIGATTASFALIRAVHFGNGLFRQMDRMVSIFAPGDDGHCSPCTMPYSQYLAWESRLRTVDRMAAYRSTAGILAPDNQLVFGERVTASLFSLIDVRPALGRSIQTQDDRAGAAPVVVISDSIWHAVFRGAADAIGASLRMRDGDFVVVGVMPPGFDFPDHAQFWTSLRAGEARDAARAGARGSGDAAVSVLGLLAPRATVATVRRELATVHTDSPTALRSGRLDALPLRDTYVATWHRYDLLIGAVALCVLIIACANLLSLVVVRTIGRQRELAVRAALGASRARLLRQFAVESAVLAGAGTLLGIELAWWALHFMNSARLGQATLPPGSHSGFTPAVFAFAVALGAGVALVLAFIPARQASRTDIEQALRQGAVIAAERRPRSQVGLVVAEITCAMILLACAGLIGKTLKRLQQFDLGYDYHDLWAAGLQLPRSQWTTDREYESSVRIETGLGAIPGVHAVATEGAELLGSTPSGVALRIAGAADSIPATTIPPVYYSVGESYFQALGIRVLRGRVFTTADKPSSPAVVIVNQSAARLWWQGKDPLGSTLTIAAADRSIENATVVGVVDDVRWDASGGALSTPTPQIYRPFAQAPAPSFAVLVRVRHSSPPMGAIRAALQVEAPDQPIALGNLEQALTTTLAPIKRNALIVSGLAMVGLLLSVLGTFGVVSFTVQRRTREFAIKMALGAGKHRVLSEVMRYALLIAGTGIALGLVGTLFVTRMLGAVLYGTSPTDPAVLVGMSVLLAVVIAVASYLPARRVLRIAPMEAFRDG